MNPVSHWTCSITLEPAPEDVGKVMAVPATVCMEEGGGRSVITFWLPTEEELAQLNLGLPVAIKFIGRVPPHYVGVASPEPTP